MATLEKIRQRKKILAIVIGAALLAFIIEVAIEAIGRSGGNSAAAKVGNEKIDIMRFQRRVEQESAADQENRQQIDAATRQQQVLDEMISEALLNQEYDKVGIFVSDNEISQLMIGKNPVPVVAQFAQQCGASSPAELYDFIMNPTKQGVQEAQVAELRNKWEELKEDVVKQIKFTKLQSLLAGCMQANDLDRAQMAEEAATTNIVNFVKKDYASVADDKYPVEDADIKAEWEKLKPMFKLEEEARRVHFIAVNIVPSAEDIANANRVVDAAYAALQKGRGIDSVRVMGTVQIDTLKSPLKDVADKVRDWASIAAIGACKRDTAPVNNHYEMYKLINKEMSLDSINMGYVIVQGDKKLQDSVMAQLNKGMTLEQISKAFPQKVGGEERQWQRVFNTPDSTKAKIANATPGVYFVLNSSDQGAQLIKVNERRPAKMFYTVATVTYDAYASTKTSEELRDKFQDYLNKNKTIKDFEMNAAKAGYNVIEEMISASTPQLGTSPYTHQGGIKDSRKAIKWAFDSKKGDVSPIFSDNNNVLVAIAVDDVYDQGYLPYDFPQAKEMLTQMARDHKKGDALMKQYEGKANDLAGYATLMGASIDTTQVVFSQQVTPKIENEPALAGRMSVAPKGKLQGPWKGEHGIYVFQVVDQQKEARKATKEELDRRYAQTRGYQKFANAGMINSILSRATKVKRSLINFY